VIAHVRISRALLILAGSLAVAMFAAPSTQAASYSNCRLSAKDQQPRSGKPTYNMKLQARGTSCSTARKVMNGFHACRSERSYRCSRKVVRRWTCRGRKGSSSKVEFYGSYTCSAGSARVKGTYQQNT
jgi:hypothetical protein